MSEAKGRLKLLVLHPFMALHEAAYNYIKLYDCHGNWSLNYLDSFFKTYRIVSFCIPWDGISLMYYSPCCLWTLVFKNVKTVAQLTLWQAGFHSQSKNKMKYITSNMKILCGWKPTMLKGTTVECRTETVHFRQPRFRYCTNIGH